MFHGDSFSFANTQTVLDSKNWSDKNDNILYRYSFSLICILVFFDDFNRRRFLINTNIPYCIMYMLRKGKRNHLAVYLNSETCFNLFSDLKWFLAFHSQGVGRPSVLCDQVSEKIMSYAIKWRVSDENLSMLDAIFGKFSFMSKLMIN